MDEIVFIETLRVYFNEDAFLRFHLRRIGEDDKHQDLILFEGKWTSEDNRRVFEKFKPVGIPVHRMELVYIPDTQLEPEPDGDESS